MTVDYHDLRFPVIEPDMDAPPGARLIVERVQVIERRGNEWVVLALIMLRPHKEGGYIVSLFDQSDDTSIDVGAVYKHRMIGTQRMRPRWRWSPRSEDPWRHYYATRAEAIEHVVFEHFDNVDGGES